MIQKVTAVYSSGISSGVYSGPTSGVATSIGSGQPALVSGRTTLYGSSQTDLSRRLGPPTKPNNNLDYFPLSLTRRPKEFFVQVFLPALIGMLVVGLIVEIGFDPVYAGSAALVGLVVIFFVALIPPYLKSFAIFEKAIKNWQTAYKRWDRLYYCGRDDIVFDPSDDSFISANHIQDLLYRSG